MHLRRALFPSAICLLIGLGFAWAQTFNRSLQLSQDTTGAFSVDTNNGVYFPGHILSPSGVGRPAPSIAGTGTPTLQGTDMAGTVTFGTSGTTATVTFGQSYVTAPSCVVSWRDLLSSVSPISYVVATGTLALTQGARTGTKADYWCSSIN